MHDHRIVETTVRFGSRVLSPSPPVRGVPLEATSKVPIGVWQSDRSSRDLLSPSSFPCEKVLSISESALLARLEAPERPRCGPLMPGDSDLLGETLKRLSPLLKLGLQSSDISVLRRDAELFDSDG